MPVRLTPAVKALMIACFALFLVQQTADQFMGGNVQGWLGLVPSGFINGFRLWQLFTYPFMHGDVMHLFLNLLMLAFIGGEIEARWGTKRFLKYYFFCSSAAGVLYLLMQVLIWGQLNTPMVGASGAIYGLLMAYGLMFGERVLLFMLLFPMKAKYFVWILMGLELMTSVFSGRGGLSSIAHLGGMIAGFLYLWGRTLSELAKKRKLAGGPPKGKKRRKPSQHLKLIINNEQGLPESSEDDAEEGRDPKTWH